MAPAPTPQAIAPSVAPPNVAKEGEGQLIIDVIDGPTAVQRIYMQPHPITDAEGRTRYEFLEEPEQLCATTPCAVNLPIGNVVLSFPVVGGAESMDVELVNVDAETTVYRRALSFHKAGNPGTRTLGVVGAAIGGTAITAGAAMLPVGLVKGVDGLTIAGSITVGVGTVVTGLGIWALIRSSSKYRPGSALHFSF